MADDRMKNDDLQRNMGKAGAGEGQDFGQQSPGRSGQGGQHAGGQQGGSKQTGGQYGSGQKGSNMDDEDLDLGTPGKTGGQPRGGQNR